jgi:hypothetical protein
MTRRDYQRIESHLPGSAQALSARRSLPELIVRKLGLAEATNTPSHPRLPAPARTLLEFGIHCFNVARHSHPYPEFPRRGGGACAHQG